MLRTPPQHAYLRTGSETPSSIENQSQIHHESLLSRSVSEKFFLPPDPSQWGSEVSKNSRFDAEDALHDPESIDRNPSVDLFSLRGWSNLGCLLLVVVALLTLFIGFPVISFALRRELSSQGGFNLGGINATGQVPNMPGNWGLIDKDTPKNLYTKKSWNDPKTDMQLVFSDEFEVEGRSFYPGESLMNHK
jgi:hypothetical protein